MVTCLAAREHQGHSRDVSINEKVPCDIRIAKSGKLLAFGKKIGLNQERIIIE